MEQKNTDMSLNIHHQIQFERQSIDTIFREYNQGIDCKNLNMSYEANEESKINKRKKDKASEEKRLRHNKISQKGRQKINEEISKLKELLPECHYTHCNKATVLQYANLENENKKLWSICQQIALDFAQATGRQYHDIITEHLMNFNEVSLEHSVSNETKNIYQFQNKSKQPDSDFRYMALSDLINQLKSDKFKLDTNMENDIVNAILKLLTHNDEVSEVKSFGVKCLVPLLSRIREDKVEYLFNELLKTLATNKDAQNRDIAASGLKSMINEFPSVHSEHVGKIFGRFSQALLQELKGESSFQDTNSTILDLYCDILSQYGKNANVDVKEIQRVVLEKFLTSRQPSFTKRTISCLSALSVISDDYTFDELMEQVLKSYNTNKKVKSIVQLVGSLSRTVGSRMSRYVSDIVNYTLKYIKHEEFEEDDELKETGFQTLESLVYRCPTEISQFIDSILNYTLEFIKYDPNYSYGSDEEDMDVEDEYSDEDEEFGYSDDDDESWKIRKSSSKCLTAIIRTRPELLNQLCNKHAKSLVKRFQEREENVRIDIFSTFEALLRQIDLLPGNKELRQSISQLAESIFQETSKQLKNKKTKPLGRVGIYQLLSHYIETLRDYPNILQPHITLIIPYLSHSFDQKLSTSQLKSETLVFLRKVFEVFQASSFSRDNIDVIVNQVHRGIKDPHYKIVTESLNVSSRIIKSFAPIPEHDNSKMPVESEIDFSDYVKKFYEAINEKFQASDADQEVKEAAIYAISLIISRFPSIIPDINATLKVLSERLKNEITRLYAVRAFEEIARYSQVDLACVIEDVLRDLTSFLRQQNRQLKQATLITLESLIKVYNDKKSPTMLEIQANIIKELEPLISESELYLSHYAFRLCAVLLSTKKNASAIAKTILPAVLRILSSSLLQGASLTALLELFTAMVKVKSKKLKSDFLLKSLIGLVKEDSNLSRSSYTCIGQCIATVVVNDPSTVDSIVNQFSQDIASESSPEPFRLLAIHTIGEIGRRLDLSQYKVHEQLLASFEDSNESIKTSASIALGGVASFNLSHYLYSILSGMVDEPKKQYLLLGSLREVIVTLSKDPSGSATISPFLTSLSKLLFSHASSEEEGTRSIVAECLGKMAIFDYNIINQLVELTVSDNMYTRATAVSALKYSITDNNDPKLEEILQTEMKNFLILLKDKEIVVRHSALLALNYAAHHKPQLIRDHLDDYLHLLYNETVKKPELITSVKLGPFTYDVDNGQPLRQAAYECMYTLLDTCLDRLDLQQFIQHIKTGLSDHYDIKTLNHLILLKLAHKAPASLTAGIESLIEPLRATLTTKVKENQAQHEKDRHEDILRSTLRSVRALSNIPSVAENQMFAEFFRGTIVQSPELHQKYESITGESIEMK